MLIYRNYLIQVNKLIQHFIKTETNTKINEALQLALKDGKRIRPCIAYHINKNLNEANKTNFKIDEIIIICELVHTISLIIDDLPCMDNDKYRRNNPTIHYHYGETSANILIMYLLGKTYYLLLNNIENLQAQHLSEFETRREIMIEILTDSLGIFGACYGQYLDITHDPNNLSDKNTFIDLIEKKTGTFFDLSYVISYIASGGDLANLDDIKKLSRNFGIIFQISDDHLDIETDKKKKKASPNTFNYLGKTNALKIYKESFNIFYKLTCKLQLNSVFLNELITILNKRVGL